MSETLQAMAVRQPRRSDPMPFDLVVLPMRERRDPPRFLECVHGDRVALDPGIIDLPDRARLFLRDGRNVEVIAAEEHLAEITGPHLGEWKRDLAMSGVDHQDEPHRILVLRDAALEERLKALGARITHISEPFDPGSVESPRAATGGKR